MTKTSVSITLRAALTPSRVAILMPVSGAAAASTCKFDDHPKRADSLCETRSSPSSLDRLPLKETFPGFNLFNALRGLFLPIDSRAMSPAEMSATMPAVFEAIATVGAPIVHYKVYSTLDNSPSIGSVGRIMEIARHQFSSGFIPIIAGTPALGRYCLFGDLFARSGADGKVYRPPSNHKRPPRHADDRGRSRSAP